MNSRRVSVVQRGWRPLHCFFLIAIPLIEPAWATASGAPSADEITAAIAALQAPGSATVASAEVRAELATLVEADPRASTSLVALYLLGRLSQLEHGTDAPAELVRLSRDHADHPLGQLAALKLLLRRLYATGPEGAEARLEAGEALAETITASGLRSDYHLAMGEAYLFHGDRRAAALRHLRAAAELGIPSAATRANVLVQIGELARLTGERTVAAASYRAFIAEFPRDLRQQIVRDRLAEVEGAAP